MNDNTKKKIEEAGIIKNDDLIKDLISNYQEKYDQNQNN
jgi:hypothetical protein